jgi:hypothetical protein
VTKNHTLQASEVSPPIDDDKNQHLPKKATPSVCRTVISLATKPFTGRCDKFPP